LTNPRHRTLRRRSVLAGTTALLAAPAIVRADTLGEWPKGPMKIVVPFPPGGSTDPVARIIQAKLIDQTGWNIIIENKPGGTGVVGAAIAAKSAPDGQTWMVTFDSHILNPAFTPNLTYKDSDLFNVMQIGQTPQAIGAHPARPYQTFAEVVADGKKRPGKIAIGVLAASQALVLMTLIKKENVTDVAIQSLTSFSPHLIAKKIRPIGVTGDKRTPALPDTPTLLEQGVKSFPSYAWWGVYCPTGVPRPIVDKMHAEITKAVRTPDVTKKFIEQFNMEILCNSPEEFAAYQKSEQERWFKVIKDNDIKAD
jgi:tripartite-type tricarboxylate transporter receptor subunit TctC